MLLHVAALDRGHRAAHGVDAFDLFAGFSLERLDFAGNFLRAIENIAVVEQVGLISEDLLHPQRPLLIPWSRQPERLVPGRQLHGTGARVLRQCHRQHFNENARDVIFRLRLGETQ